MTTDLFPATPLADIDCPADLPERWGEHLDGGAEDGASIADNNAIRAGFAATAVKAFADRTGLNTEDMDTTLGDLLADLMHLCDALGLPFADMVERAHHHHDPELKGIL